MSKVVFQGERPKMDTKHTAHWPSSLRWLMKSCWHADPMERPTYSMIRRTLEIMLSGMEEGATKKNSSILNTENNLLRENGFKTFITRLFLPLQRGSSVPVTPKDFEGSLSKNNSNSKKELTTTDERKRQRRKSWFSNKKG